MLHGICQWLSDLLRPPQPSAEKVGAKKEMENGLERESELQRLRLQAQEQEEKIEQLKAEMERRRSNRKEKDRQLSRDVKESVLRSAASPVAQLKTQAHLLKNEGKPVEAGDILAVAERLVDSLAQAGLALEGEVGQIVTFDPNMHEALGAGPALHAGDEAVVRVVGVACEGKVLKKAGVAVA